MAIAADGPASGSVRSIGASVAAGPLGGLVLGGGMRIAMRVAAVTGGVPTEFTAGGTIFLLVGGALVGVLAGLLTHLLNLVGPLRRLRLGGPIAMLLVTAGLLGPNGFRELSERGHLWLNIITFAGAALLAGLVLDVYANRLMERRQSIVRAR